MKRIASILLLILAMCGSVRAENKFTVANTNIPLGEQGEIVVNFEFENEGEFTAYQFDLALPEGISLVPNGSRFQYIKGDCYDDMHSIAINYVEEEGVYAVACVALTGSPSFTGTSGMLLTLPIQAEESLTVGTTLNAALQNVKLSTVEGTSVRLSDVTFKITIGDEPVLPPAASVSIKMGTASRDLEALGYSSAYGLDFTDITKVKAYIASGYTSKRKVLLSRVYIVPPYTGIYLKTTEPGCEVEVPTTDEDIYYANLLQPLVERQSVPATTTINGEEFLNFVVGILDKDNPDDPDVVGFIRLKKTTTVGPNRCVLPVPSRLYPIPNAVREIDVVFDDEATGIEDMDIEPIGNVVYDLQGRKVSSQQPQKGFYIVNGKKVYVK